MTKRKPSKKSIQEASKCEVSIRVKDFIGKLMQGYTRAELIEYAGEAWGIKKSAVDVLIQQATKRVMEYNEVTIEQSLATITANYWKRYRLAEQSGDAQLCAILLRDIAKLKGLGSVNINIRKSLGLTEEELDEQLG